MDKDRERIQAFLKGDEGAFNKLVQEYHERVYRMFHRLTDSHHEADELTQLTFIRVYKGLPSFRGDARFSTWLYRIAYNTAMSYLRKARLRSFLSLDQVQKLPATESSQPDSTLLKKLVGKLPPRQQLVIHLRVYQELSFKNIAEILEISESTAKVHYLNAIKNLKKYFQKEGVYYHDL